MLNFLRYTFINLKLYFDRRLKTHDQFINVNCQFYDWYSLFDVIVDENNWNHKRIKLHQEITQKLLSGCRHTEKVLNEYMKTIGENSFPSVIIVKGGSGSGKSTYVEKIIGKEGTYISPDLVRGKLKKIGMFTAKKDDQYDLESFVVTRKLTQDILSKRMSVIIERRFDYWDDLQFVLELAKKYNYKCVKIVDFDIPVDLCLLRLLIKNSKRGGSVIPYSVVIEGHDRLVNGRYVNFCKVMKFDVNLSYIYYFYNENKFRIDKKILFNNGDTKLNLSKIKKIMSGVPSDKMPLILNRQSIEKYQRSGLLSESSADLFEGYVGDSFKNAFRNGD